MDLLSIRRARARRGLSNRGAGGPWSVGGGAARTRPKAYSAPTYVITCRTVTPKLTPIHVFYLTPAIEVHLIDANQQQNVEHDDNAVDDDGRNERAHGAQKV